MERNLLRNELVTAPGMRYLVRFAKMLLMERDGAGSPGSSAMNNGLMLRLVLLFLATFCSQAEMLFDREAIWRWRPGTSEASIPVTGWRDVGFVDAEFSTAPAPFWYGDSLPGGTQISGMQNVY